MNDVGDVEFCALRPSAKIGHGGLLQIAPLECTGYFPSQNRRIIVNRPFLAKRTPKTTSMSQPNHSTVDGYLEDVICQAVDAKSRTQVRCRKLE